MPETVERVCAICTFAEEHGYTEVFHCPDCHRSWRGLAEAHCPNRECCQHFTSDAAFDLHLTEKDGCKDPASARRKNGMAVYRLVERAGGPAWSLAPLSKSPYASKKAG